MSGAYDGTARAQQLQIAFNPAAAGHIRLTRLDNDGGKKVVTRRQAPSLHEYSTHLHEASRAGPGALGLSPTFATSRIGATQRLLTAFAAIDLDATAPKDAQDVVEALAARGVPAYLSAGTSGRGTHVFVFFEEPIPCSTARAFVQVIAESFAGAGICVDKTFPSTANGVGASILLPYRAAAVDGVGANPLLIAGDLRPLPLHALAHMARMPLSVIERINAEHAESAANGDRRRRTADSADPVFRVTEEVARLAPVWQDGRRTNLTLGFSGAAAMAGVPMAVVVKAIVRLERGGPDAPRVTRRVAIVKRTYHLHQTGNPIAFARFYENAGVPAPVLRPHHAKIQACLALVDWRKADTLGRSAPSARRILHALWNLAARVGRLTEAGVSVSVSRRQLAELSGLAVSTVNAKMPMLVATGVLRTVNGERHRPGDAARVELLVQTNSDQSPQQPVHGLGGQHEWSEFVQAWLFSRAGLGPTPGVVAATLGAQGPMDRAAIAAATGRAPKTILRALRRLEAHDLVQQRADGTYALANDAADRLADIETRLGVDARLERRVNRIREEQHAWRRAMADKRQPVRPTPAIRDATRIDIHEPTEVTRSGMMKRPQVSNAAAPRVGVELARAATG
jgi:CRP-like cAMP-binding protein